MSALVHSGARSAVARWLTIIAGGLLVLVLAAPTGSLAAGRAYRTCGYFHALDFTYRSRTDRWRAYIQGQTSCAEAISVLRVVIAGGGQLHNGPTDVTSYTDFDGWRCPAGEMNIQTCHQPERSRAPYSALVIASDCANPGCPNTYA